MATVFEVLTVVGGLLGALLVGCAFLPGNSAIQAIEIITLGLSFAVIPYCIGGALHRGSVRRMLRRDNEA
jgi:uncharacterized membrane protein YdfJ with MMPL/SSD domain